MYLIDVNVLVYTANADAEQHEAAAAWLDRALNGPDHSVGIPWANLIAYLRITTSSHVFKTPADPADSWHVIKYWLSLPSVWVPHAGSSFLDCMEEVVDTVAPSGKLVTDAYLAALAKEHALTMISADQGFRRFSDAGLIRWTDPLATEG